MERVNVLLENIDYVSDKMDGTVKPRGLSLDAFTLKIIAITSMALHHTITILWEIFPIWLHIPLYFISGITFPIMSFFLTEGFRRTSNVKKYMLRLLVFGLLAQIPYMLSTGLGTLNIIFTILLGLIGLMLYDSLYVKAQKRTLFVVLFIVLLIVATFTVEGQFFGPILILLFYVIKDEKKRRTYPLIIFGALTALLDILNRVSYALDEVAVTAAVAMQGGVFMQYQLMMMQYFVFSVGTFAIIPLLRAYNGEKGRNAKYLFYAFYPLHFAVLAAIAYALGLADFSILGL
jgi:hypothetical protein